MHIPIFWLATALYAIGASALVIWAIYRLEMATEGPTGAFLSIPIMAVSLVIGFFFCTGLASVVCFFDWGG